MSIILHTGNTEQVSIQFIEQSFYIFEDKK